MGGGRSGNFGSYVFDWLKLFEESVQCFRMYMLEKRVDKKKRLNEWEIISLYVGNERQHYSFIYYVTLCSVIKKVSKYFKQNL